VILGRQILQMTDDSRWVDHSDRVIGVGDETLKQIVDQETGLRGYLVTGDRAFLEPFELARPLDGFSQLRGLVSDSPQQQVRFDETRRRYEFWLALVTPSMDGQGLEEARKAPAMLEAKRRMDAVRDAMSSALDVEYTLRRTRIAASTASTSLTRFLFVILLAASAIAIAFVSRRQLTSIAATFRGALASETQARQEMERETWVRAAHARLVDALQGERTVEQVGADAMAVLAEQTEARVGAFFTREGARWQRRAGYALDARTAGPESFANGEGIVGEAAARGTVAQVREVPPGFLQLRSGTGQASPAQLVLIPARADGTTTAVVELGFAASPGTRAMDLLGRVGESIALAVRSAEYKRQLRDALEETQRQAEELQSQQEELRVANEELETQATTLRTTQQQLEQQQAELEQTNENLVQQATLLERQNTRLADTQSEIASKAREVERASQFKSEFLSNMSHELRTPLNAIIGFSEILYDGSIPIDDETSHEYLGDVLTSGKHLLQLINDVLDLAKVEAGKMEFRPQEVELARLTTEVRDVLRGLATSKQLRIETELDPALPVVIVDPARVKQVLYNFLS
ncbi:MAG TPA: CHASE3 domain-containing protein, partial [Polyangiaceae bacterium]|nr:CHASE3 domain-containing protein [Polyangiaceae bacterium]